MRLVLPTDVEPYRHQVGGHSRLIKPKSSCKIYKPWSENESRFYEKLSALGSSSMESGPLQILKKFVPKYYGSVEVTAAITPPVTDMMDGPMQPEQSRHIILEDLVDGFIKPCVLDIKMGKRQRKMGSSPDKEKRQLEKSLSTTSGALGFRLCGCQYYDRKSDSLCFLDKYWGRRVTKDKVQAALQLGFWNGSELYTDLFPPLLEKLQLLQQCVTELRHYRFWSSSLLIVYDGGLDNPREMVKSLDVRMIDFANTIFLSDNPTPDEEYVFGLRNLSTAFQTIWSSASSAPGKAAVCPPSAIAPSLPPLPHAASRKNPRLPETIAEETKPSEEAGNAPTSPLSPEGRTTSPSREWTPRPSPDLMSPVESPLQDISKPEEAMEVEGETAQHNGIRWLDGSAPSSAAAATAPAASDQDMAMVGEQSAVDAAVSHEQGDEEADEVLSSDTSDEEHKAFRIRRHSLLVKEVPSPLSSEFQRQRADSHPRVTHKISWKRPEEPTDDDVLSQAKTDSDRRRQHRGDTLPPSIGNQGDAAEEDDSAVPALVSPPLPPLPSGALSVPVILQRRPQKSDSGSKKGSGSRSAYRRSPTSPVDIAMGTEGRVYMVEPSGPPHPHDYVVDVSSQRGLVPLIVAATEEGNKGERRRQQQAATIAQQTRPAAPVGQPVFRSLSDGNAAYHDGKLTDTGASSPSRDSQVPLLVAQSAVSLPDAALPDLPDGMRLLKRGSLPLYSRGMSVLVTPTYSDGLGDRTAVSGDESSTHLDVAREGPRWSYMRRSLSAPLIDRGPCGGEAQPRGARAHLAFAHVRQNEFVSGEESDGEASPDVSPTAREATAVEGSSF